MIKKICKVCDKKKDISEFKINRKCKDKHTNICQQCINTRKKERSKFRKDNNKKYYIYKLLNINDEVIYVGQTTNMNKRMYDHKINNYKNWDLYSNIYKIRYAEVESDYHMNIYEIHYICKYDPKYNIQFKTNNKKLFNLPEVKWKQFVLKDFIITLQNSYILRNGQEIKDIINSNWYKQNLYLYEELEYKGDDDVKYINDVNKYFNPNITEECEYGE